MSPEILAHAVVAAVYAVVAGVAWHVLRSPAPGPERPAGRWMLVLLPLALTAHGIILGRALLTPEGPNLGFGNAISLVAWLATLVTWIASLAQPVPAMLAMLLPASALCALMPALLPNSPALTDVGRPFAMLHIAVALAGYALFIVAALQAIVLLWLEKRLHTAALDTVPGNVPPLLTLERFLFQLIVGAFVMLTLTLVSGALFSEVLFDRAFRFNHKNLFSVLAWFVFAAILFGRFRYGWRGRKALTWVLVGSALLMLAYVGSKFVFEVLLNR